MYCNFLEMLDRTFPAQPQVTDNKEMTTLSDFVSFILEHMNTNYPFLSLVIPFRDLATLGSSHVYQWCERILQKRCITYIKGKNGQIVNLSLLPQACDT